MTKNFFWSEIVQQLNPYVPGEQPINPHLIKLNTNENPYPPSADVREAILSELNGELRLYPDPDASLLKETISKNLNVQKNQVFVGNGSDEVLAHIFYAFFKQNSPIFFPDVTYSFYETYSSLYEIPFNLIPLTKNFCINIDDYKKPNGGIIFPNPNAPTGRLLSLSLIEDLLRANQHSILVVDEAYIDFGGKSCIPLISKYSNLLVTQSLSKSRSLAGLRVGFAVGNHSLIEALNRVKNSFNSYPMECFEKSRKKIIKSREKLSSDLVNLEFSVIPSAGNFLFATHHKYDAAELASFLRKHNILVRHFNKERIKDYLRITIGLPEDNEYFIRVIKKFS
jgi:histidinol-phosphate aminotransferase